MTLLIGSAKTKAGMESELRKIGDYFHLHGISAETLEEDCEALEEDCEALDNIKKLNDWEKNSGNKQVSGKWHGRA